jgi:serine/threonine protein phosphatase PrpC
MPLKMSENSQPQFDKEPIQPVRPTRTPIRPVKPKIPVKPPVNPEKEKRIVRELRIDVKDTLTQQEEQDLEDLDTADIIPIVRERQIDNGNKAETLKEAMHSFELPGGIEGVAATSMAGYKYELGKDGQPKMHNEDRWVIDPNTGLVAVIDGMGGGTKGEVSAELLAENITLHQDNIPEAVQETQLELASDPEIGGSDGACFISGKMEIGQPIEINQSGDVDLYHISASGQIKFKPGDHMNLGKNPQSTFDYFDLLSRKNIVGDKLQEHVNHIIKQAEKGIVLENNPAVEEIMERIAAHEKPYVKPSNPLYQSLRKSVTSAVMKEVATSIDYQTPENIEAGDWILMMSDGVTDNFEEEEILGVIQTAIRKGWSPEMVTEKLSAELDRRIQMKANNDPLTEQHHFKLDNATLVVMRVKSGQQADSVQVA